MKSSQWFVLASIAFLSACEPKLPITINILDAGQIHTIITDSRNPSVILTQAGFILGPADRLLFNGYPIQIDQSLPSSHSYTLQIRRAVILHINDKVIQSSASTVGEVFLENKIPIYLVDNIDPPTDTPVTGAITINFQASKNLQLMVDAKQLQLRSNASTIGGALSNSALSLQGLDTSKPPENERLPLDGLIHVIRVAEAVVLAQKSIPFSSEFQPSSQVELDHQDVLQPGQTGLSVSRTRIRYEDGVVVSRQTESDTVVRSPQDRIVGYGTKVVIHTVVVDGVQIKYWRAIQMFTTAYSPCNSGGDRCYPGTSSGKPVQKGVVAIKYSWYLNMQGQSLFIPGYGYATIEDVCGGCVGKPWIDLGYTDAQFQQEGGQWGKYVTVYFLAPAPSNILFTIE